MNMLVIGLCLFVTSLGLVVFASEGTPTVRKVVILLGPPGSGKGTQAVRLSKNLEIPHISTGDLFRENIGKGTLLGKKARSYIDSGKLVPDDLVLDMLFERVSRADCTNGYLLDGFPRTIPQAEAFDAHLTARDNLIVLNLEVADNSIVKRIEGRLSCKQCGNIQNRYFTPPVKDGICDKCGSPLIQRADDKAEVVQERLRVYHQQTEPLIEHYSKKSVLQNVDGEKDPAVVFADLLSKIKSAHALNK